MDTKYARTTITLPEDLLYEIKKKALAQRKTIKEIIQESLSDSLGYERNEKSVLPLTSLFGTWGKGETGNQFLKRVRHSKEEKEREIYLKKIWKKY